MIVYIVSAGGPYAEKAIDQRFYLDPFEAESKARELTEIYTPAMYRVYTMVLTGWDGDDPFEPENWDVK